MSILNFCAGTFALLLFGVGLAQAETWRWTDAEGQVHYGDRPPAGVQAERLNVPSRPSPLSDEERARRRAELRASRQ